MDTHTLARSVDFVVRRHESLRTRVVVIDGTPKQQVEAGGNSTLEIVDLTQLPTESIGREARRLAREFIGQTVDLSAGPLFEAKLWKLAGDDYILLLALHHMVGDDISNNVLSQEIWTLYAQATNGSSFVLPSMCVQFGDYAMWQEQTLARWRVDHEGFWRAKMSGARRTDLPADNVAGTNGWHGCTQYFALGGSLTVKLQGIAESLGASLPIIVLTTYAVVLSHWCDREDLIIAFVSNGRKGRPELEKMIGFLATFLHLRIEVTRGDSFVDLVRRVRGEVRAAFEHRDFDRVPIMLPQCTTELYFNWLSSTSRGRSSVDQSAISRGGIRLRPFTMRGLEPTKFSPFFYHTSTGIIMAVHYRSDFLLPVTIERFGTNLRTVAETVVECPITQIGSLLASLSKGLGS